MKYLLLIRHIACAMYTTVQGPVSVLGDTNYPEKKGIDMQHAIGDVGGIPV
ncbi:hypothetical protein QFZ51_003372 [Chitinophaga sp. W3I9]|uniref:hypothetical protein n=1 Tax=unclassified Chitinophaga TaxID=2619133 RepID=UPI003D1C8906